jgi:ribosome-binding protein aMBF1 (putative translation factor)
MQHTNSNVATNVSESRKKMGLSQEALAEKATVSLSTN